MPPGPSPGRPRLGEHQHPLRILKHALERGNLVVAEITARELGGLDLVDALELTALIALRDPQGVTGRSAVAATLARRDVSGHSG